MKDIKFFIDTGDEDYIKTIWESFLSKGLSGREVVGITTNPNAMSKCNIHNIVDFEKKTHNLCKLVSNIRNDNKGVVYVQHPDSNVSVDSLKKWIDLILTFSDGNTKVGLKIPPYQHLLELVEEYQGKIDFNVTGVADCSTALMSFTYSPRYVSLIPGRMEEKGIDAVSQMKFIDQRKNRFNYELITGSMRTVEGLLSAIQGNTVPTIGTRVFDILKTKNIDEFIKLWSITLELQSIKFSPHIDQRMTDLSVDFFKQMDSMGEQLKNNIS